MKKIIAILALMASPAMYALEFTGSRAITVSTAAVTSAGLEAVYVVENAAGVTVSNPYSGGAPTWERYSNLGGGFAEPIPSTNANGHSTITLSAGDMGYIVEHEGRRHCYWVVDYSQHELDLESITPMAQDDCDRQQLAFAGHAEEIAYYTINGRRMVLPRNLEVEYTTLKFDEDSFVYTPELSMETVASISSVLNVPAPLTATSYRLSGDRFLSVWGREQSIESETVQAYAVDAQTRATQQQRDNDNEQKTETDGLGGSAPCVVNFEAAVTDAALFHEWQISRDPEFENPELRYTELEFDFTFNEQGTTYVRFVAANGDGSCEYIGPTYEVFIGESKLEIPNAFSPQNQDGVNDEWKVSYKSLVSYECSVFNRWGQQMFTTTDPAEGWDGRYGGKFVPAGVYYYVIKAEGADGVRYNKAGDINIVGYSQTARPSVEE